MSVDRSRLKQAEKFQLVLAVKEWCERNPDSIPRFENTARAAECFSSKLGFAVTPGNLYGAFQTLGRPMSDIVSHPLAGRKKGEHNKARHEFSEAIDDLQRQLNALRDRIDGEIGGSVSDPGRA